MPTLSMRRNKRGRFIAMPNFLPNSNMRLIGHADEYDIYEDLNTSEIWEYSGNSVHNWNNPACWKRVS